MPLEGPLLPSRPAGHVGTVLQVEPLSWVSPTSTISSPLVSQHLWVFHLSQACPLPLGPSSPDRATLSQHAPTL